MDDLAFGDHISVIEPLQDETRKNNVRGGRADIDAYADQNDFVLSLEAAPRIGKEYPPACVFLVLLAHGYPLKTLALSKSWLSKSWAQFFVALKFARLSY